jgi:hypothetical protein
MSTVSIRAIKVAAGSNGCGLQCRGNRCCQCGHGKHPQGNYQNSHCQTQSKYQGSTYAENNPDLNKSHHQGYQARENL